MAEQTAAERRIEIVAAVLLSVTTILTAWTAFQSAKWSGVMAIRFSEAGATRTESVRFSTQAGQQASVDVGLFVQWAQAVATDEIDLADFLRQRFRDEFTPALEAWLATDPLHNPDSPPSPFAMDEYRLASADKAAELEQQAEQRAQEARDANQQSDDYVLTTVLFAVVLFFVGIGTKFESLRVRIGLLVLAGIGLAVGISIVATFPIEL